VGHHLVHELVRRGDRVRCLVRRPGVPDGLEGLDLELAVGDVTRPDSLPSATRGVNEVYHLAARLTAMHEHEMFETNAMGTRNLLEAVAGSPDLVRFVHCSSLAVAGPCRSEGEPVVESITPGPVTWYGRSKALAERAVATFARAGLPTTVVRPPVVYGPRDRGLLSVFQAVAKGLRPLLGRRPKSYSWIYGPDLAEALVTLGRHPATVGRTYFATHEIATPMETFLDAAASALDRRGIAIRLPESMISLIARASDLVTQATGKPGMLTRDKVNELIPDAWVCSGDEAARDTGWRARTPLAEGVATTARWYRDEGWL
jgi:nucleoside-diphosphate-sugar epimerase